jgi:hypothetical protein
MGQNDLRPGQYKRIGRIAEKNPDRAERVAARMTTRSERKDRGKEIADQYSTTADKKKKFGAQLAQAVSTGRMSSMSAEQIQSAAQFAQKMGRDVPLATTPQLKQK